MKAEPLTPLGVRITDIDITCHDQLQRVRELLWKHGVIIFPAGAAKADTPDLHIDESLCKLGQLFGSPEEYHPVNKKRTDTSVVQVLRTLGDSGRQPDSYLFHSDITWRVNPATATVLCAYEVPSSGGDTCFQSTNKMFHLLTDELREKLYDLSFFHSLKAGYGRVNRPNDVKNELSQHHPAIIKHPQTGLPLLFISENFATSSPDISREESDDLLEKVFSLVYRPEYVLAHKWTKHDVLIWDNLGTQHMARADYTEPREMHRVVIEDPKLRLERYVGERASVKTAMNAVQLMLDSSESADTYASLAARYDELVNIAGYKCPYVGTEVLAKHLRLGNYDVNNQKKILDVAAGTGLNAMLFQDNHSFNSIEALDYTSKMLSEARRRNLYEKYHVHDANVEFPIESEIYDGVICTGGLAPNQINPQPALSEMVRITKPGGYVVFTVEKGYGTYGDAVHELVKSGVVQMAEEKCFVGMKAFPDVQHAAFSLRVM